VDVPEVSLRLPTGGSGERGQAPGIVRAFARGALAAWQVDDDVARDVEQVASELAAAVLRRAPSDAEVLVRRCPTSVRVLVRASGCHGDRADDRPDQQTALLDALTDSWGGVDEESGDVRLWADVPLAGTGGSGHG